MQSLGNRIKKYEAASSQTLIPNCPVFIRVDGRAFHTYTKGFERPFDSRLTSAMNYAARQTAQEMQGFKLAYGQSDEYTFCITDLDSNESQGWFDYKVNKLVSMTASLFTAHFNQYIDCGKLAFFDARAFSVPMEDAPNVFVWRQQDWERNSIQMLAQSLFSHKELQGKKKADLHEMCFQAGHNWNDLEAWEKNGSFILPEDYVYCSKMDYNEIFEIL